MELTEAEVFALSVLVAAEQIHDLEFALEEWSPHRQMGVLISSSNYPFPAVIMTPRSHLSLGTLFARVATGQPVSHPGLTGSTGDVPE